MAAKERADADAGISAGAVFDALYEHAPAGIALFSIGGKFLRANAALCRLLGYSEEELLQKTHLDVVHLDDLEATAVSRAQAISGKAKGRLSERRYIHKDGSTIWAHAGGAVGSDSAATPLCRGVMVHYVSALKASPRAPTPGFGRLIERGSAWYL